MGIAKTVLAELNNEASVTVRFSLLLISVAIGHMMRSGLLIALFFSCISLMSCLSQVFC